MEKQNCLLFYESVPDKSQIFMIPDVEKEMKEKLLKCYDQYLKSEDDYATEKILQEIAVKLKKDWKHFELKGPVISIKGSFFVIKTGIML